VNLLFYKANSRQELTQVRLFRLAVFFHAIGCTILTLAPAVRYHSWAVQLRWQQWIGFLVWFAGFIVLNRLSSKYKPDHDPYLLPLIAFLTAWGLLTIYRLDPALGLRQTLWLAIAMALFIVIIRGNYILSFLRRYKYLWLSSGLLLTVLTFLIGVYPSGTGPALWFRFFGIYFQPSELLKILLVVFLAAYFAENLQIRFNLVQLLMPTLLLVGIAFLILVAQHDLGTASLLIAIYAIMIYLASGKRRLLLISFLVVVIALLVGYQIYDVIQLRIEAWVNPWLDPNGRSYQIVQSIIAIANGGVFGRGLGLGSPGIVPVSQSDFIFAAIFEETGLFGAAGLLLLLVLLMSRGFSISLNAPNQFQRLLAAGITAAISVQAILIIGGNIRMLPLTGVTLPFVSYGGSSLAVSFIAAGLLLAVSNQGEQKPAALERATPYRLVSGVFLAAFSSILVICAWWSVIRSADLLSRNDNPRRFISDAYVMRGSIYSQDEQLLAGTTGEPGSYSHTLNYPLLSSVIGYSHPQYGQTGLEASQDSLLRGDSQENYWQVFRTRLLYGQYPQGYDLRTTIDMQLQQTIDPLLENEKGSILVMNAASGEILAIATSPTFDANSLADNMDAWKADENSPLLNRATQGLYPPGSVAGGLLLNQVSTSGQNPPDLPVFYRSADYTDSFYCADAVPASFTWPDLVSAGCPFALEELGATLKPVDFYNLYLQSGLLQQPEIQIESAEVTNLESYNNLNDLFNGKSNLLVTPLQVALAYAPFSNGGHSVEATLVTAYKISGTTWQLLNPTAENNGWETVQIASLVNTAANASSAGWKISSTVPMESGFLNWYVQGTPSNWKGIPIVLVVALENSTPEKAKEIGVSVYTAATNQ
jgi:cell division protein FtsW (lipid II flippase)